MRGYSRRSTRTTVKARKPTAAEIAAREASQKEAAEREAFRAAAPQRLTLADLRAVVNGERPDYLSDREVEFLVDYNRYYMQHMLKRAQERVSEAKARMLARLAETTFQPSSYRDLDAVGDCFEKLATAHPALELMTWKIHYFMGLDGNGEKRKDCDETAEMTIEKAEDKWNSLVSERLIQDITSGQSTCPLRNYIERSKMVAQRDHLRGW